MQELVYSQRISKLLQSKWKGLDIQKKAAVWLPALIRAARGIAMWMVCTYKGNCFLSQSRHVKKLYSL